MGKTERILKVGDRVHYTRQTVTGKGRRVRMTRVDGTIVKIIDGENALVKVARTGEVVKPLKDLRHESEPSALADLSDRMSEKWS